MKKLVLTAAVLALASGFAWAQSFEEIDVDGDGLISSEEAAGIGMDVSTVDTDGDGALSQEEFDAAMGGEPTE
jgi:Ca2+-binding EF-hand superfamily protein